MEREQSECREAARDHPGYDPIVLPAISTTRAESGRRLDSGDGRPVAVRKIEESRVKWVLLNGRAEAGITAARSSRHAVSHPAIACAPNPFEALRPTELPTGNKAGIHLGRVALVPAALSEWALGSTPITANFSIARTAVAMPGGRASLPAKAGGLKCGRLG
jgi:hypothetical protein